jgi:Zinc finger, C2H2 type
LKVAVRIKKKALVADEYFKKIVQPDEVKLLNDIKSNMLEFQAIPSTEMVTEIKQEVDPADFNADDDFNWPEYANNNSNKSSSSSNSNSDSEWNAESVPKPKNDEDDEEIFSFNPFQPAKKVKQKWKKRDRRTKQGQSKRTYVKGGTKDGICDICGINLTTKERLRNHIKVRHEIIPEEEFLKCPVEDCRKRFKIKLYLDRHMANIHNKDEKPPKEKEFWPCSFCGIILGSKTALKQHEYRHTVPAQEKKCHTFFCDICGFSSDKKIRVQYHIERIHLQLRKFKCKMCPADFVHSSLLQYHELRVHLNLRKFVCRYCDKSFTRSSCRLIHERIHTNERPYR